MKTIIVTILMSFILTVNTGYSQMFEWAYNGGSGINPSGINAQDIDGNNNIYVTGSYFGQSTFSGSFGSSCTLTGSGNYIAKYNTDGAILWAVNAGSVLFWFHSINVRDIACDNDGNSYIIGSFNGTLNIGEYTLNSLGVNNVFIAKFNNSGVCLWAISTISLNFEGHDKISLDNEGNFYIAGEFDATIHFPSVTLTSNGFRDIYLAKYSSSGVFLWAVSGGSATPDEFGSVTSDADGTVYITGILSGIADFSGVSLDPDGMEPVFFVKYNSSGDVIWGKTIGEDISDQGRGIGVDNSSNSYLLTNHYFSRYNSEGNPIWNRSWSSTDVIYTSGIKTDIYGNSYICGIFSGTASFPPYTVASTGNLYDIFVAKYDLNGDILWVKSGGGSNHDWVYEVSADILGNTYIMGFYSYSTNFGFITLNSTFNRSYLAKISSQSNLISGKVFFDYDNNGIRDVSTEPVFPEVMVTPAFISTNASGDYYAFCGDGLNSVSILFPPLYYTPNPVSHSINFSGYGNISENNDFGLYPTPNVNDLRITLTDAARARPGFHTTQLLTYKNVGTTTLSGTITLLFDDNMTFISSSPGVIDITANPISWNYSTISPNEERRIFIEYNLPASVPLGTILTSTATIDPITGDYAPANNVYNLNQVVTGSYDPNDKSVDPVSNLTLQNIQDEDSLTYTVRFQNTGTDTAFTVKVTDTLSSKLNIPSIETIASSHDYDFSIKNGNILIWTFNNILLPDSTTNEVKSHGFVKYRIKPKNSLVEGDVINNSANIYFDFNVPVITNTTVTRVGTAVKYLDLGFRLEAMYPHPDSIKVYLANSVSPFGIIDTSTVFSQLNGPQFRAVPSFRNAVSGTSYYIIIKHRNSIETWSANPVVFNPDTTVYDFTTSRSKAYGNNMVLVNNEASIYTGETENDGLIDMSDVIRIYNEAIVFTTGDTDTDLNGDDLIDLSDLLYAHNNASKFVLILKP